jgi:hypothetical protein
VDFDPDKREFVDAVMAPLEPDPIRRDLLKECLAIAGTVPSLTSGDSVDTATRRIQSKAKRFKFLTAAGRSLAITILALTAWTAVIGPPAIRSIDGIILANRMADLISTTCCSHEAVPSFPRFGFEPNELEEIAQVERVLGGLPHDARLLLLGDYLQQDELARWKAVWDRYPENPAHYFAYALAYRRTHEKWPDDFVATGESLDPGNGWFRLLAGAEKAKAAVGMRPPRRITQADRLAARAEGRKLQTPLPGKRVEILDQATLDDAYTLLDQALRMPRWDDYRKTLNRIRFDATPPPSDFASHSLGHILVFSQPEDGSSDWLDLRKYGAAFGLTAKEVARHHDASQLASLRHRVQGTMDRLGSNGSSFLLGTLVARVIGEDACWALAETTASVSGPAEAGHLVAIAGSLDFKLNRSVALPPDALSEFRGSGFQAQAAGFSRRSGTTPVTEPQLRGGRLAEYAMYERFIAHLGAAFLALALAFVLIRSAWERKRLGLLPERLTGLLSVTDRIRIVLVGALLPVAVYFIATRLPALDPREFAFGEKRFILWLVQIVALGISVILLSLDTASRCLGRRATMLAMRWHRHDPGWIFAWVSLASIPILSILSRFDPSDDLQELAFWTSVGFMVGIPLLWLLNLLGLIFAGAAARKLHRAILLRSLVIPLAIALPLIAASIPIFRAEERYWITRLDFDALHPDYNTFSPKPEIEYAAWMAAEVRRAAAEMAK